MIILKGGPMYNDNKELLKLVGLNQYDIDQNKTTIHVNMSTNEITIHLQIWLYFYNLFTKTNVI